MRSKYFVAASQALENVRECGGLVGVDSKTFVPDFKWIQINFDWWMCHYSEGYWVRLYRVDGVFAFIRMYNRFHRSYAEKFQKAYWWLRYVYWDIKLEFTIDPKNFSFLGDEYVFINLWWARLRAWLFKSVGKFGFLRVFEVTKKGRPHLHILLSMPEVRDCCVKDKDWFACFRESLRRLWMKYGGGYRMGIRRVWSLNATNYVLKYVQKTFGEGNSRGALLFASNRRLFSVSRRLVDFALKESIKTWWYSNFLKRRVAHLCAVLRKKFDVPMFHWCGSVSNGVFQSYMKEHGIIAVNTVVKICPDDYGDSDDWKEVFGEGNV